MEHSATPGPSSMNLVASIADDDVFNPRACIICQEDNKSAVTSEKAGRARINQLLKPVTMLLRSRIKSVMGDEEEDNDSGMFCLPQYQQMLQIVHTFWQTQIYGREKC